MEIKSINNVILFWIFYMMTVLYIYDDGIFTEVEILQDYFLVYKS